MTRKEEEVLEAWAALVLSYGLAVRKVSREIRDRAPLTLDEYDVLLVLSCAPEGRMRFSNLAHSTVFTRSGITRIVRRLEGRGYIERQECMEDRRGAFAVLTSQGKHALAETWKWYSRAVLEILENCLSQAEARTLATLLGRIIDQLSPSGLVTIGRRGGDERHS